MVRVDEDTTGVLRVSTRARSRRGTPFSNSRFPSPSTTGNPPGACMMPSRVTCVIAIMFLIRLLHFLNRGARANSQRGFASLRWRSPIACYSPAKPLAREPFRSSLGEAGHLSLSLPANSAIQRAVNPPSTIRLWPVTNDALLEHNHKTASATSSTRPRRPMG
jgi:hypothetical protein